MDSEYRCFFFGNFYFSSIQQGIQAQHVQREIALKYLLGKDGIEQEIYKEYGRHHKTVVLKNGGDDDAMQNILSLMQHAYNDLPWNFFIEPGAGESLSSVGIVVPSRIFDELVGYQGGRDTASGSYDAHLDMWTVSNLGPDARVQTLGQYSDFEWKLAELIRTTQLAR